MKFFSKTVPGILVFVVLAGCAVSGRSSRGALINLSVEAEPGANRDTATPIDFVFIYDTKLVDQMPRNSTDWFARRSAFESMAGDGIAVVSREVVPLAPRHEVKLPNNAHRAVAVYFYAQYHDPKGRNRGDLTSLRSAVLRLETDHVVVIDDSRNQGE